MKNVLLAVSGLSPQVITEALYALWHQGRPVSRLEVITTRTGKDKILSELFSPVGGKLDAFLEEFGIARNTIDFGPHLLHVIKDEAGVELTDILSPEDNEILLRTCLNAACRLTSVPDLAVFFLVAGGRKTMTSCLTLAAQLYGRAQDRLYHVLVTPDFEQSRDFWYPPKVSKSLALLDGKGREYTLDTKYAVIDLISIPFISVRDRLDHDMLSQPRPPGELLASIIRDQPSGLVVNLRAGKLAYRGIELDLYPAHLALYAFFAERKKNCSLPHGCRNCDSCYLEVGEIMNEQEAVSRKYRQASGGEMEAMSDSGIMSLNQENFNSYKSKINRAITRSYGQGLAADLVIDAIGQRPNTRYGLRLDRSSLCLEW